MPKYDDNQYDAGGDSFGAIFGELFAGAAEVGSRGSAGVFMDFVEFLESNVDGYSGVSGGNDDAELAFLLQTGSLDEVGEEMDDTELVVQQLTTKLKDLGDELVMILADLAASSRFSEKIALEEREAECKARKGVVEKYLQKARKRLLALQTRYKQLIVGGANDNKAGGRSTSRSGSSEADTRSTSSGSASSSGTTNSRRASSSSDPEDAWKTEGFGSNGRGRGSGRRRSSRSSQRRSEQSTSSSSASSSQYRTTDSSPRQNTERQSDSSSSSRSTSRQSPQTATDNNVPPHRRTGSYQAKDDADRLRQLKVEDEFEKLKKDLGL